MQEFGGGEALFLQGTAGDITPWRRGAEAVQEMAVGLAKKAKVARQHAVKLVPSAVDAARGAQSRFRQMRAHLLGKHLVAQPLRLLNLARAAREGKAQVGSCRGGPRLQSRLQLHVRNPVLTYRRAR